MTKRLTIFFIICLSHISHGQTPLQIKQIFYDMPLDSTRTIIAARLRADKKFIESHRDDTISIYSNYLHTFHGTSVDKGLLNFNPDSIEIELTQSIETYKPKGRLGDKVVPCMIFKIQYYSSSHDLIKSEYLQYLSRIRQFAKDSVVTGIGSNYDLSAEGITYKIKSKSKIYVEVLIASLPKNNYGLYINYRRNIN